MSRQFKKDSAVTVVATAPSPSTVSSRTTASTRPARLMRQKKTAKASPRKAPPKTRLLRW